MNDGKNGFPRFEVDTHLFRELGELLVGRESTALIELIKNAYDADATEVTVFGHNLHDQRSGMIRISDNGTGMSPSTFRRGFLRIASRIKTDGERRSLRYKRRFTGAKGVGRLAAHKLARKVEVQSIPWAVNGEPVFAVDGRIDWDLIEAAETLDDIAPDAITVTERRVSSRRHGTVITLTNLRKKWTAAQRTRFLMEVESLQAPSPILGALPRSVIPAPALFDAPLVTDSQAGDPGFILKLEGDFETGQAYWPAVLESANWLLEIDASAQAVRYGIVPTVRTLREYPAARSYTFSEPHPALTVGPFFQARILLREGQAKRDERAWSNRLSGVRVYMEGFRVLPYGDDADDWLFLARDYTARDRKLRFLTDSTAPTLHAIDDEGLLHLSNKHFFGGVFLTVNRSGTLEMLVNREGFVPDSSFEILVTLVRRGIDLLTRVRAVSRAADITSDFARPDAPSGGAAKVIGPQRSLKNRTEGSIQILAKHAAQLRRISESAPASIKSTLLDAAEDIGRVAKVAGEVIPANTMVLVLASVGTQLAAFTHEVSRLLGLASDLEVTIARLRDESLPSQARPHARKVELAAADLRRAIERHAAYLMDIVTPDARRRRSRQRVLEVLNATWKLVETAAEHRGIKFRNEVDPNVTTPPMFRAELMAVFANLLTNAVKAAGDGGLVHATAEIIADGSLRIRIENTGQVVDPRDGERWFRPFESTTVQVDPVLGQGMGLGLTITRDILADLGAHIAFVAPGPGAATALEITFPGASR